MMGTIAGIIWLLNGFVGLPDVAVSQADGSAISASTMTAPAVEGEETVRIFLDRFGSVYVQQRSIEPDELIFRLRETSLRAKPIVVEYEPLSFPSDRQRILELLSREFPNRSLQLRQPTRSLTDYPQAFPNHQSAVQQDILSRQKTPGKAFYFRHLKLLEHFQSYVGDILDRMARARMELNLRHRELQHITTRNIENPG
jgi:hypothetical protein